MWEFDTEIGLKEFSILSWLAENSENENFRFFSFIQRTNENGKVRVVEEIVAEVIHLFSLYNLTLSPAQLSKMFDVNRPQSVILWCCNISTIYDISNKGARGRKFTFSEFLIFCFCFSL